MATFTLTGTLEIHSGVPRPDVHLEILGFTYPDAGIKVVYLGETSVVTDANGSFTTPLTVLAGSYYVVRAKNRKHPLRDPITNAAFEVIVPSQTSGSTHDISEFMSTVAGAVTPSVLSDALAARDAAAASASTAAAAAASVAYLNWQATTAYTSGQIVRAPDGSTIASNSARTSRATFDATEASNWTVVAAKAGTLERIALDGRHGTYLSVKDPLFGAKGDGTTDDTPAIQAALTYLVGITAYDASRSTNLPTLFFPPGRYRARSTFTQIASTKIRVLGSGENASQIWYDPTSDTTGAVLFDFGTFSTTPADIYAGNQDVTFESIRIQHANPGAAGSRKGQAIRSSGGGGLVLKNVIVNGFKYGVNCPYGGDFNHYFHTLAEYCDVGFYLGPGSQQVEGDSVNVFGCVEGMVLDRCAHIQLTTPSFNSCATAGLVLEAITDTSTRQLTSFSMSGTSYAGKVVLQTPWFESNAGGLGDAYTPTHYIQHANEGTDTYRNIEILNPYIVGSGPTKTPTSLFGNTGTRLAGNVRVVRPVLLGAMTYWLYNPSSTYLLEEPFTASGYTAPTLANNTGQWFQKSKTAVGEETWVSGALPITQKYERLDKVHGIGFEHGVNGIMRLAFETSGSWIYRLGFDIQNRRVFLDDPNTASSACITRSSAMPTSGSFGIGSFVFNTAPSVSAGKVCLGWLRLTTGSAHVAGTDWTPFFGTTS